MYVVQFRTCKDTVGALQPKPDEEYETWATYADRLLMGQDLKVDLPGQQPDEHIDTVVLAYADDGGQPFMVATVALVCPCAGPVDNRTSKSRLYTPPQPRLVLPR